MKIFAVSSRSFHRLRDEWFLATLPSDMEPVLVESPADSIPVREFGSPQWRAALDFKLQLVCDTIRDHPGEVVCFSDVDVQFFGSFKDEILRTLADHDVSAMRESGGSNLLNGGFYAIRCAPHVEALWEEALFADKSESEFHDQDALNAFLEEQAHGVRLALLPDTFWASHRHLVLKEAEPHAMLVNHATGWPDKGEALRQVRDRYSRQAT
jgi:hypothetical protein